MACRDCHDSPSGVGYRKVYQLAWGTWQEENGMAVPWGVSSYSISFACHHCEQPACQAACPKKAIQKDQAGRVWIQEAFCVSCRICIKKCPNGAISFNAKSNRPEKCDLCRERLERGKLPVCVEACPMRCLEVLSLDELLWRERNMPDVYRFPDAMGTGPAFFIKANRRQEQQLENGILCSLSEEL